MEPRLIERLGELFPQSSKNSLRAWIKAGRVSIDGKVTKDGNAKVKKDQKVALGERSTFVSGGIRLLYEDKHLVVIDKPQGMLSVATAFEKKKTVHALLKDHYAPRQVYVVHRLDQHTSGVMLFALSEEAQKRLKNIFEKHLIERAYTAIIEGKIAEKAGTWKSYLYEDSTYTVRETSNRQKGELAISHYHVLKSTKAYSWLNITLETGRKNQIRVHCQQAGHPVVGDKKYGASSNPLKRLCLHAHRLAFTHPMMHKKMCFESPIPSEFFRLFPKWTGVGNNH